ncbi:hypothetical protein DPV73_10510 [Leptospira mayottensis]|nr:hypothetical protein DPV73_10510 [Leptospira mayottensis]
MLSFYLEWPLNRFWDKFLIKNELQGFGSIFYKAEVKLPPSSSNKVLILKRTLSQTDFFFIC